MEREKGARAKHGGRKKETGQTPLKEEPEFHSRGVVKNLLIGSRASSLIERGGEKICQRILIKSPFGQSRVPQGAAPKTTRTKKETGGEITAMPLYGGSLSGKAGGPL